MKTSIERLGMLAGTVALGLATVFSFQNCSSGDLPPGLTDQSSSSTSAGAAAIAPPLSAYASAAVLAPSASTVLNLVGGTPPYTFTVTGGTVSQISVASFGYTAPATTGSFSVTFTDGAGVSARPVVLTVNGTSSSTPTTTVASSPSKQIYMYLEPDYPLHAFADSQTWAPAGWSLAGPAYKVMADASSGGKAFYRCALPTDWDTAAALYFDTVDPSCEGQSTATSTLIGYVYTDSTHAGTVPLYRFASTWTDHFDSTDANFAATLGKGWTSEGAKVWVPAN